MFDWLRSKLKGAEAPPPPALTPDAIRRALGARPPAAAPAATTPPRAAARGDAVRGAQVMVSLAAAANAARSSDAAGEGQGNARQARRKVLDAAIAALDASALSSLLAFLETAVRLPSEPRMHVDGGVIESPFDMVVRIMAARRKPDLALVEDVSRLMRTMPSGNPDDPRFAGRAMIVVTGDEQAAVASYLAFVEGAAETGRETHTTLVHTAKVLRDATHVLEPVRSISLQEKIAALSKRHAAVAAASQAVHAPASGAADSAPRKAARLGSARAGQKLMRDIAAEVNGIVLPPEKRSPKAWDQAREAALVARVAALSVDDKLSVLAWLGEASGFLHGQPEQINGKVAHPWEMALYIAASEKNAELDLVEAFSRVVPAMRDSSYAPPRYARGPLIALQPKEISRIGAWVKLVETRADAALGVETDKTLRHMAALLRGATRVKDTARLAKLIERIDALLGVAVEDTPPFDPALARPIAIRPHPAPKATDEDLLTFVARVNGLGPALREAYQRVDAAGPQQEIDIKVGVTLGVEPKRLTKFRQIAAAIEPRPWFERQAMRSVLVDGDARPLAVADARRWLSRAADHCRPRPDWSAATPPGADLLRVGGKWTVLRHLMSASGAEPTAKWLKQAESVAEDANPDATRQALLAWLGQIADETVSAAEHRDRHGYAYLTYVAATLKAVQAAGYSIEEAGILAHASDASFPWSTHTYWALAYGDKQRDRLPVYLGDTAATLAKGAVWTLSTLAKPGDEALIADVARQLLFKPGSGIFRSLAAANACIWALGRIGSKEAVVAMGRIRRAVRDGRVSQSIEKAMRETAARAGMSVAELEEIAVPDFGLDPDGSAMEEIDGYTVTLRLQGGAVQLDCVSPAGKALKSVPPAVKKTDACKELIEAADEIARLLPLQKERIERSWLDRRGWSFDVWKERYVDHPLVGAVARRLVWTFESGGRRAAAMWQDGGFVDAAGLAVDLAAPGATVALWHPIDASTEEVAAWRRFMVEKRIRQPFKQAHRELYVLTDAERTTATFSNRFAAHILKQHQYMALAKARGWSCRHRMWVDAPNDEPTRIDMPGWDIWGEIFIEGAGGDEPDTLDSGAYVYVRTDQVRFHRDNLPMRLEDVPPLVFSEVMRDCDLFCGVASIGADPNWINRGADARRPNQWHHDAERYWHDVSFGDLAESAKVRRDLIAELLPMMAVALQCEVHEKYLRVKGRIRAYRIHFNSGNILMEPDDRYLCIVPADSAVGAAKADGALFLPFEGDRLLSTILSKAILLADDNRIKDETILRQIR